MVGAAVASATGVTLVTGRFNRARTTSRSVRGTSSTTVRTAPPVPVRSARPMVAVVVRAGLPAGTVRLSAGFSAKQLAAVSSQSLSTRTPEQPRSWSPTMIWAA
ncbi:hypothetical protein SVIOM342S_05304 [Streptomyces violaceorubidus]